MGWLAIDTLGDVREATQSLLLPVDRGVWLRLAVIAFFVGGGVSTPGGSGSSGYSGGGGGVPIDRVPPFDLPPRTVLAVAAGVIGAVILLALVWSLVGAVMEFVLVEDLSLRDVRVRGPFRAFLGKGARLFGFRIVLLLLLFALIALPVVGVFLLGIGVAPIGFLLLVPAFLLIVLVALAVGLITWLTTDFVVPTMLEKDVGVLAGWRRVLPVVRAEWREVGLYLVLRLVLGFAAGIAVALVVGLVALVLAIPFVAVGGVIFLGLSPGLGTVGVALLVLVGLLFVVALFAVVAVVQVPVVTFFRYYALFVLGGLDADLDLVADLRTDDRDGEGAAPAVDDVGDDGGGGAVVDEDVRSDATSDVDATGRNPDGNARRDAERRDRSDVDADGRSGRPDDTGDDGRR